MIDGAANRVANGATVGAVRPISELSKDEKDQLERSNKKAKPIGEHTQPNDDVMMEPTANTNDESAIVVYEKKDEDPPCSA